MPLADNRHITDNRKIPEGQTELTETQHRYTRPEALAGYLAQGGKSKNKKQKK